MSDTSEYSETGAERKRQPRALRTEARILEAARSAILEHGFDGATTAEIARRGKVAEGTIFVHFGNKVGLLAAVMNGYYGALLSGARGIEEAVGDPLLRLRRLTAAHLQSIRSQWRLVREFARFGRFGDSEFNVAFRRLNRTYTEIFMAAIDELRAADILDGGVPATRYRDAIFGTTEHFAIAHFEDDREADLDAVVEQIFAMLVAQRPPDRRLERIEAKLDRLIAASGSARR